MQTFYIILLGALVACSCSLLGCYLLLRKMSMVGDAISHAVLPGIVIAYLITGSRGQVPMLIGAGITGVVTTYLIEFLNKKIRVQEDAAIGIVFTWLFALGVILISVYTDKIDLDQDCVLYGEIGYVGLGTVGIPQEIWVMGSVLLLILAFIILGYRPLFITTFDAAYATTLGISTALWHYLLMSLVSLATVAAFDAVGSILVVAFLVIPAATAYLLTDSLKKMLIISCVVGIIGAAGGYWIAAWLDSSIAAAMSTLCGVQFLLVFFGIQIKKRFLNKPILEVPLI